MPSTRTIPSSTQIITPPSPGLPLVPTPKATSPAPTSWSCPSQPTTPQPISKIQTKVLFPRASFTITSLPPLTLGRVDMPISPQGSRTRYRTARWSKVLSTTTKEASQRLEVWGSLLRSLKRPPLSYPIRRQGELREWVREEEAMSLLLLPPFPRTLSTSPKLLISSLIAPWSSGPKIKLKTLFWRTSQWYFWFNTGQGRKDVQIWSRRYEERDLQEVVSG